MLGLCSVLQVPMSCDSSASHFVMNDGSAPIRYLMLGLCGRVMPQPVASSMYVICAVIRSWS